MTHEYIEQMIAAAAERRSAVAARYMAGEKVTAIAADLGLSKQRIYAMLARAGIKRKRVTV